MWVARRPGHAFSPLWPALCLFPGTSVNWFHDKEANSAQRGAVAGTEACGWGMSSFFGASEGVGSLIGNEGISSQEEFTLCRFYAFEDFL